MWQIKYALGGGFGGLENEEWEDCEEANSEEQAIQIAAENARQLYESYEGLHGLRDINQIMEEENCSEFDACEIYDEEVDNWIEYDAREVKGVTNDKF